MSGGMLPDGTATKNNRIYVESWRKLGIAVAKHMGGELIGFDPDILLLFKGAKRSHQVSLPLEVAKTVFDQLPIPKTVQPFTVATHAGVETADGLCANGCVGTDSKRNAVHPGSRYCRAC